jgi:hypothetical protein
MKSNYMIILTFVLSIFIGCKESSTSVNNGGNKLPDVTGYPVVSTNQTIYYDTMDQISAPLSNSAFYGQDAQYSRNEPRYQDNSDGTITDLVTGLMWQKSADLNGDTVINYSDKLTYSKALAGASKFSLAGYNDWRLPTIKELYSLIMFSGKDPRVESTTTNGLIPFINTQYFDFAYGDLDAGERIIDAQYATSTLYVSTTMGGSQTMFGVNFADGRIKGYGLQMLSGEKTFYVKYVRGNAGYGVNNFTDNGDTTITDNATGLMWMKNDSRSAMNWEAALSYAENLEYAGHSDWRLPDAKELQTIVDYTRSPSTTNSASINPLFNCTPIINEAGEADYASYWTSTTHQSSSNIPGAAAVYINFGRGMGYMFGSWIDVHGAGAQRSDPKAGNPKDFPFGRGPQGDAIRIFNYVRCVRTIK